MPLNERGVADILRLGRYNYTSAKPALSEHAHRGAIEICFLVKGVQTYRLGRKFHRLRGGDVFVTLPGERHDTGGLPQEKGILYWMLIRLPRRRERFLDLPGSQASAMLNVLLSLKHRHFRGSWKMKEHLDAITSLYHSPTKSPELDAFSMANRIGAFLLEVVACAKEAPAGGTSSPIPTVLHHIGKHLDEELTVPYLAALAGLSEARFKALFKQEVGTPPGEYVMRARVLEAQRRLREEGSSVTRISYDLGFSSSQYFATVFKRFTGQNPGAFRASTGT